MYYLLVDLYQDCSYDAPGVKTGPARGGWGGWVGHKFETYDAPGVKTGLAPRVTSSKHRNKDGKLQNSSFLKLEGAEVWYLVCSIS